VVIKPGGGTQLSLELQQRGGSIEAQAVLQRGDFAQLNQHWSDLQQRLEQRGVKLAPLVSEQSFADVNGGQKHSQRRPQPNADDEVFAGTFAGLSSISRKIKTHVFSMSSRTWETWA